jgi:hypothetical protein
MPNVSAVFDFDSMTPPELEQRRRDITSFLQAKYGSAEQLANTDIDDVEVDDKLRELAALTSVLRRRTSGPPKVAKVVGAKRTKAPKSVDDI